ncbi:MAG: hypothetical protein ACJAVV_002308 [Alphaproteobacteria bacterium]|jgi:hypothetical protein
MEKILSISCPTVTNKLDKIANTLRLRLCQLKHGGRPTKNSPGSDLVRYELNN